MTKYMRLCRTVNNAGDLIPFKGKDDIQNRVKKSPNADWYTSLYLYPEEAKEFFEKNNSAKGYSGEAYINALPFDLDCKSNVAQAQLDAIELINRFETDGIDVDKNVKVWFSGNKGFHIFALLENALTVSETKELCTNYAEGVKSFDSVIYNNTRLFRVENTKHQTSKLYKIPLTITELKDFSMTKIKELASTPRKIDEEKYLIEDNSFLDKYKNKTTKKPLRSVVVADTDGIRGLEDIDFSECPNDMPRCVFALTRGVMEAGVGERSEILLRLAAYYRNQGLSKEATYGTLKGIIRDNAILYPDHEPFTKEELWNTAINSTFTDGEGWESRPGTTGIDPNNATIVKYCDAVGKHTDLKCCLHNRKNSFNSVVTVSGIEASFNDFATNFQKNIVKTGINFIDDNMKIAVGTTTIIAGACGSGKTTLGLTIMENANELNQHTIFFSLDMHKNLVYLKLAQKLTRYTQDQILDFYKNKDQKKIAEIRKAIADKYGTVFFDFSTALTIEEMGEKVLQVEEKHNCKIKLAIVDYAGRVPSKYSDIYASARHNALKSTQVANETDAAWLWMTQVSRNTGDGSSPLRSKRVAKDSGDWEESATNVITVWRPFMGGEDNDDVMRMFLAKNRMGKELERPLHWDGAKGKIWDMTEDEYLLYKEERAPIENGDKKKSGWS